MSLTAYSMLSTQPRPLTASPGPRGGILLNAIKPHHLPSSNPQSPSSPYITPSSPSSTSSASASDDSLKRKQSPSRRITFAPLPKPRLDDPQTPIIVLDHVSDAGLPYDNPDAIASLSGDDVQLPQYSASVPVSPSQSPKKSSWSYSTKKLLRPFYKPLQKATLEVDGGALGLFRPSSRDSASSVGTLTDGGAPLGRRMSTGSSPFDLNSSGHVASRRTVPLTKVTSENGGVAAGTRLLNGRVYGGSRLRAAQSKEPEREPEFVEWGYGGMGSNRSTGGSSSYAAVQRSHSNVVAEDDDDGSGMGWVRKRREARERERREREEREALEAKDVVQPDVNDSDDVIVASPTSDGGPDTTPVVATEESPEHITRAVTIPVRPVHPHHGKPSLVHRTSDSRPPSISQLSTTPAPSGRSSPMDTRPTTESAQTSIATAHGPSGLRLQFNGVESPESSDDTESDEEDADNAGEEDEDDEDEEDEEDALRKTSQCAGVEKISRHKE